MNTINYQAIRLKRARENFRLSQEQAAKALGLDRGALIRIENGSQQMTALQLAEAWKLYQKPIDYFLYGDDRELSFDELKAILFWKLALASK